MGAVASARARAKASRDRPGVGKVRVWMLPKDPLVARTESLWPIAVDLECASVASGPTGPHAVVVDYNADLDVRFAPAKLAKSRVFQGLARRSPEALLADFRFHQVNVWAIVERTLQQIEDPYLLGRAIPWASQLGRLILLPHAGYQPNAFYDRGTGALHFCYFEGPHGAPVYTCLSHDVVAHELGHAVLDGLKPFYNEVSSPETAGFHEYFGDAVAMMASLSQREIALLVVEDAPDRLSPRNLVSAIASEFGAALRGLPDEAYLRGAWNDRRMASLQGTFEEHDWSEVLTGVYYDLLEYLYPRMRREVEAEDGARASANQSRYYAMRALSRAATVTAGVMFRGLDYCPPVDLRYGEYARAVLRADAVAYPLDSLGIRARLERIFARRGIDVPPADTDLLRKVQRELRDVDVERAASTPADAYRFLDAHRERFGIPYEANFSVCSVYRTNKLAKSGYRPPKEHVVEFVWTEDVPLYGRRFGALDGQRVPLYCGGTLVFDANGNFVHRSLVPSTAVRRRELCAYVAYLVETGSLGIEDGVRGLGAPDAGHVRVTAVLDGPRVRLQRNAAMRHAPPGAHA
jgi:hypothetical protein